MPRDTYQTIVNQLQYAPNHWIWNPKAERRWMFSADPSYPCAILKYNGKQCNDDNPQHRLAIYSPEDCLGQGKFAVVHPAAVYSINYQFKEITYKKDKVVKAITHECTHSLRELIKSEYELGKESPHLGIKQPVFDKTWYLVMNRLPGTELFFLINDHIIDNFSTDERFQLTHQLLIALRDQVTSRGIIHRDIKPENILVDIQPDGITVNLIDYGFAINQDTQKNTFSGSRAYAAPEILLQRSYNEKCDLYSMAKVIALLWVLPESYNTFIKEVRKPPQLASMIKNLNTALEKAPLLKDCPALLNLISHMLAPDPETRPTLNESIEAFEYIDQNLPQKHHRARLFQPAEVPHPDDHPHEAPAPA